MLIYHGSQKIVQTPTYGIGALYNDYGQGFYCTESIELAKEWACPEAADGFANKYELNLSGLSLLNLNGEGYHILNWIAILLKNRIFANRSLIAKQASQYLLGEFLPDITGYDVICGYRADDSYFSYAKDFLNNTISVAQLAQAMKLGELGEQVVLVSERAFGQIEFLGYEVADASIYHSRRAEREERARNAYLSGHGADFVSSKDALFVRDILTQEVKNYDPRLQ